MIIDLANFQAASVGIRGVEMRNVSMMHSALLQHLAQASPPAWGAVVSCVVCGGARDSADCVAWRLPPAVLRTAARWPAVAGRSPSAWKTAHVV
jgi:hypothetical protein